MNDKIDPTKLKGYRPEWSVNEKPAEPPKDPTRTVPKIISPHLARKISAAYRCAACWSDLKVYWHLEGENAGKYTIECVYCGGDVPGFVTRTYIQYRIRENEQEYMEARMAMRNAERFLIGEPQQKPKLSPEEQEILRSKYMKELGF